MRASLPVLARAIVRREKPSMTTSNSLCVLCFFAVNRYLTPCSESLPETDFEIEVVGARGQLPGGSLLILSHERESIGNAIFQRQNLIWIGSDVRRIGDCHFLADSSPEC